MFGRSDMSPPDIDMPDGSLTRKAAQKQRIISEFWEKWSTSYHQTLVKYHRWILKHRNARPGDVVMMLDKEVSKGKFCIGIIDSVKVDDDNQIRKVIVKYKVRAKNTDPPTVLRPTTYKYTERNVRGLALLIKAEEIDNCENIDLDQLRLESRPGGEEDDESNESTPDGNDAEEGDDNNGSEEQEEGDENNSEDIHDDVQPQEEEENENNEDKERMLPPSSTGRKRMIPKKFLY